jgi:hypothetical protein
VRDREARRCDLSWFPRRLARLRPEACRSGGVGSPTGVGLLWGPSSTISAEAGGVAVAKLGAAQCAVQLALVPVPADPQGIFRSGLEDSKA